MNEHDELLNYLRDLKVLVKKILPVTSLVVVHKKPPKDPEAIKKIY